MIDAMQIDLPASSAMCLPTQPLIDAAMMLMAAQAEKAGLKPPMAAYLHDEPAEPAMHEMAQDPMADNIISNVEFVLEALIKEAIETSPMGQNGALLPPTLQPLPETPHSQEHDQLQLLLQTQLGEPISIPELQETELTSNGPSFNHRGCIKPSERWTVSPPRDKAIPSSMAKEPSALPLLPDPAASAHEAMQLESTHALAQPEGVRSLAQVPLSAQVPPSGTTSAPCSSPMAGQEGSSAANAYLIPTAALNPPPNTNSPPLPFPPPSPPLGSEESEKGPLTGASVDSFNFASIQSQGLKMRLKILRRESNRLHKGAQSEDGEVAFASGLASLVITEDVSIATKFLFGRLNPSKIEAESKVR